MGCLNRLFGSYEDIAKDAEYKDEEIIKHWQHYINTIPRKKELIENLKWGNNFSKDLHELRKLLDLELVDIDDETRDDEELIKDLESIEHSKKVRRVERLEECLDDIETRYEYIHQMLNELHKTIKNEIHITLKLISSFNTEKLILHLKQQLEIELEIIKRITSKTTFHKLLTDLVTGEHIIRTMDKTERRMLHLMQDRMKKIFAGEIQEGITREWALTVYNAVQDKIEEMVADANNPHNPPYNIDFQIVNRSEFVDLVKKTLNSLRTRKALNLKTGELFDLHKEVSEQMINVFVHTFREWYNHGRD